MPKILVVEDDLDARKTLSEILECAGYQVSDVESGAKALSHIDQGNFNLVITDILMPEMDGVELIRRVHKVKPNLPVIAITGGGERRGSARRVDSYLSTVRHLGATGFDKPLDYPAFLRSVGDLVGSRV